jgi:hypothetical protein
MGVEWLVVDGSRRHLEDEGNATKRPNTADFYKTQYTDIKTPAACEKHTSGIM